MVYGTAESEFLIVLNSVMGLLKKDGEAQLARLCKKRGVAKSQGGEGGILHAIKRRGANWIGHTLRRTCLLKHITEWKIEETRRRERRRKQLLDDLKERRC
jgi:hypothetical protein